HGFLNEICGIGYARLFSYTAPVFQALGLDAQPILSVVTTLGAGLTTLGALYPLDYAVTRQRADLSKDGKGMIGVWEFLQTRYNERGFRGLYKGFAFSVMGLFGYQAVQMASQALFQGLFGDQENVAVFVSIGSTILSGMCFYPLDTVLRSVMVCDREISVSECANIIFDREGISGFYGGVSMILVPALAYGTLYLSTSLFR
ncbi:hypothetical protein HDV03_001190, partial [Kappamyces sp. JEL0829]